MAENRRNYREEWGDVLQRVLHLGGCYNVTFTDNINEFNIKIPESRDKFFREFYELNVKTYLYYRNMKKDKSYEELFKQGLVKIAHYCVAVSLVEYFDIEQTVKEKIEKNKSRVWNTSLYNEKLKS